MRLIRLYFEGHRNLRPGFARFLNGGPRLKLVSGGSKEKTMQDFEYGCKSHPDELVLLLVDSEGPLTATVPNPTRFFMVQLMESWFLADQQALAAYFGHAFQTSALPANTKIEAVSKADVISGLDGASRRCKKGKYSDSKVTHGRELLSLINPNLVRGASPECDRLFEALDL